MPVEVSIWRIDGDIKQISLGGMDYESRLQQIIADDISVVDPNLMVVGREVVTSYGGKIDILAMDGDGNLVVVELKRDRTPRDVVAQTLDYGSWVRHMTVEEIADTFIDYQQRFVSEDSKKGISDALSERFNFIPDEPNKSHRLVIVAAELDPSTERIVTYLQEEYGVDINVVFFQAFQDGECQYLTRAWLTEPDAVSADASASVSRSSVKGEWNGEYYVNYAGHESRNWNDAGKYGFVSAGGGDQYVKALRKLQPGNRIWVYIRGTGYVGVGVVTKGATHYDHFNVRQKGNLVPLCEAEMEATVPRPEDEHFVGVKWTKTVDLQDAVKELGFFTNQNTVAQPRDPRWHFTVDRLKSLWGVQ